MSGEEEGTKILHVDDEPDFLALTKAILERENENFSIEGSTSAEEGVELLKGGKYDVVISDYKMPGMDGLELLQNLRQSGNNIPFIMFTGKGREEVAMEALNKGANYYLQKGVDVESMFGPLAHAIKEVVEKKRAEESLRESEERLSAIFEGAQDAIFTKDRGGHYIHVNPACASLFELTVEGMIGKTDFDIFPPEVAQHTREKIDRKVLEKGETVFLEDTKPTAGVMRTFHVVKVPLRDANGEIAGLCGIARDITERKRMGEELENSKRHFQTLFKNMVDPVVIVDEKGVFQEITDKVEEISGFKREELLGKNFLETKIVTAESKTILAKSMAKRMKGMKVVPYEIEVLTKDGRKLPYEVNAARITYMGEPADMVVFRDITERKRAEEILQNQKKNLQMFFDNVLDGILILDYNGRVLKYNSVLGKMFELESTTEGVGRTALEFILPEFHDIVKKDLVKVKEGRGGYINAYKVRSKSGKEFWIEGLGTDIIYEGKHADLVSLRDITERKRLEEALEQRLIALTQPEVELGELKLTDIIDVKILQKLQDNFAERNRVASVIFNNEGEPITRYSNFSEFCKIIRSTAKGLEGCKRSDAKLGRKAARGGTGVVPCGNIKEIMDGVVPIIIQGQHIANWGIGQAVTGDIDENEVREFAREIGADEEELVNASKELVRMPEGAFEKIIPFLDTMARQVSLLGLQNLQQARDITERKQLVKELEESHKFLEIIIENIPDTITLKDSEHHFVLVNPAYCNIIGLTEDKVIGKMVFREKDDDVFRTGKGLDIPEITYTDSEGNLHYASVKKVPLADESGKTTHVLTVSRDITERKQSEEGQERVLKELEAKNAELNRFTFTVSHDLRSPLISIQGFAEMLRKDLERNEKEKVESDLKFIENSATKMDRLLTDTLQLSRIGRFVNPPEDVPFGEIVQDAQVQTTEQIKSSGVEVSVVEDYPTVHVDRMRIEEVLVNLITNSINYMGEQPRPKINIGYRVDEEETVFFVRDNGIGIDKSQHEKVFELFYKVDKNSKGTGAGLAIVKRIIEVHEGRIWIESEKGKGCTVCFTLPVA
jgi:PAS domain S-box-containing protein